MSKSIKKSIFCIIIFIVVAVVVMNNSFFATAGKRIKCKSVKLNVSKATILVGDVVTLSAVMNPKNSTETIKWKSNNKRIATVNQMGCVTAISPGTATITIKTSGGKKDTVNINVKKYDDALIDTDNSKIGTLENKVDGLSKQVDELNKKNDELKRQNEELLNKNYMTVDQVKLMLNGISSQSMYDGEDVNKQSVLYDKKVVCFGDSITWGQSGYDPNISNMPWPTVLSRLTGAKVVNMGMCGATLAYIAGDEKSDTNRDCLVNRISYIDFSDIDYVFIAYGTNDLSYGIPIGNNDDTDPHTYKGAANYAIKFIHENNPNTKVVFVTSMLDSRKNTSYIDATVEIAEHNGCDYIDMRNLGIKYDDLYDVYWDHTTQMHPTESTYYAMGVYISKYPDCKNYKCHKISYSSSGYMDIKKSIAVEGEKIKNLLLTVKAGYEFVGWYTEDGDLVTENTVYSYDKDIVLYAKFIKRS